MLQRYNILKPLKPKMFIIWPLTDEVCQSLPRTGHNAWWVDPFLVARFWKGKAGAWKWFPWWLGLEVGVLGEVACLENVVCGVHCDLWMAEHGGSVEQSKGRSQEGKKALRRCERPLPPPSGPPRGSDFRRGIPVERRELGTGLWP